jgi:glycosyltransferase involved in cell wall biosynthesis
MKVSVIVPARNEEKSIAGCLTSLKNQDYASGFETIVVDDGSTDRTGEISHRYGARVIRSDFKNIGYSRNLGTKSSSGDICFYMDADSIAPKNWISRFMEEYENDKRTVMVGSLCNFDEVKYDALYQPLRIGRTIIGKLGLPMIAGSSMSILKEVFYKAGGFVDRTCEDGDICFKAKKFGKVKMVDDVHVFTSSRSWKRKNGLLNHYVFNPAYVLTNGRVNLAETTRKR